jgi:hypothetical protein
VAVALRGSVAVVHACALFVVARAGTHPRTRRDTSRKERSLRGSEGRDSAGQLLANRLQMRGIQCK